LKINFKIFKKQKKVASRKNKFSVSHYLEEDAMLVGAQIFINLATT